MNHATQIMTVAAISLRVGLRPELKPGIQDMIRPGFSSALLPLLAGADWDEFWSAQYSYSISIGVRMSSSPWRAAYPTGHLNSTTARQDRSLDQSHHAATGAKPPRFLALAAQLHRQNFPRATRHWQIVEF